jgi:hypothetical protein
MVAPGVELLARAPVDDELADRVGRESVRGRVDESAGWEVLLDEELESVLRPVSLGEERSQSVLPLEAVLPGSWQ